MLIEEVSLREKTGLFRDRKEAGELLGAFLLQNKIMGNHVLVIPSGGIPVGIGVARKLRAKISVCVVRKILYPWTSEAGFGALSWNKVRVIDYEAARWASLSQNEIEESIKQAEESIKQRTKTYSRFLPPPSLKGKKIILVDDGLATGYTMLAAVRSAKKLAPLKTIVAVPTASDKAIELLTQEAVWIVTLNVRSSRYFAVADAYIKWRDLPEKETLVLLEKYSEENQ